MANTTRTEIRNKLDDASAQFNLQRLVPQHDHWGIIAYINYGIEPGHFLTAVICNDLKGAFARADETNRASLYDIVYWFWNYAPSDCWGSVENFKAWTGLHSQERTDA